MSAQRKVKPGDALVIPAQTFNTFIAAARDFRGRVTCCIAADPRGRGFRPVGTSP